VPSVERDTGIAGRAAPDGAGESNKQTNKQTNKQSAEGRRRPDRSSRARRLSRRAQTNKPWSASAWPRRLERQSWAADIPARAAAAAQPRGRRARWPIPLGPIPLRPIPLRPIPLGPIPLGPISLDRCDRWQLRLCAHFALSRCSVWARSQVGSATQGFGQAGVSRWFPTRGSRRCRRHHRRADRGARGP
jgi:hypothetical protein